MNLLELTLPVPLIADKASKFCEGKLHGFVYTPLGNIYRSVVFCGIVPRDGERHDDTLDKYEMVAEIIRFTGVEFIDILSNLLKPLLQACRCFGPIFL